jgi:5-methylcytosine-specific restriction endonuclease McrA
MPVKRRSGTAWRRTRLAVLAAAGYRCQFPGCGRVANTIDHITPLAQGGTNELSNLRAACARCNYRGGSEVGNAIRGARIIGQRSRDW